MHCLVPFAAHASPACRQAARGIDWSPLARLLARLLPEPLDDAPADSLSLPHERALARALGLAPRDGLCAGAAWAAWRRGLGQPGQGWARITPTHWAAGSDQVELRGPEALQLPAGEEAELFAAVRSVFEPAGFAMHRSAPGEWLACHETLRDLPTLSLDRVIGRPLETWLRPDPAARTLRRLQSEAQMLLHTHPVNARREALGQLSVNSVWLSDTGALPAGFAEPAAGAPERAETLRLPALQGDGPAWAAAWARLLAQAVPAWQGTLEAGQPLRLTLCGERAAASFTGPANLPWWQRATQRWRMVDVPALLEIL